MPTRIAENRKCLTGTMRGSRKLAVASGERLTNVPPAPAALSPLARVEWAALATELVEAGMLRRLDLRALRLLAETLGSVAELAALVAVEGATLPGAAGARKGHPALMALGAARSLARQMLADFGMTPRGKGAVEAVPETPPPGKPASGLASFRK